MILLLLLASLVASGPTGVPGATGATIERHLTLMGTEASLRVTAPTRGEALAASERALRALEATETRLSTWTDRSELARYNARAADPGFAPSPELSRDLAAAFACREATAGAFDPALGELVAAWGLRTGGREPSAEELKGLDLHSIDEGAWGKGAALDHALAALDPRGGEDLWATFDLGGQLMVSPGHRTAVVVADPRDRARPLVAFELEHGSVATSGNGERGLRVGGRRVGHLLDPRTRRPATDFGSVTVWAPTGLEADCLSTGLYVLGPEAALAYAADHPGIEVVVVEGLAGNRRRVRASAGLAGRLQGLDPQIERNWEKDAEVFGVDDEEGAGTSAPQAIGPDSRFEP